MGKNRKRKQKADFFPPQTLPILPYNSLSTEDLKTVIVDAFLEIDSNRAKEILPAPSKVSNSQRNSFKWTWQLLTTNANKLHLSEGPISTVKLITALVCSLFAWFGYLIAVLVFLSACFGIYQICKQPSLSSVLSVIAILFMSLMIVLISKILSVTSIEIEKNTENNVIFGVSGFFMSLATLILTAITILSGS